VGPVAGKLEGELLQQITGLAHGSTSSRGKAGKNRESPQNRGHLGSMVEQHAMLQALRA